MPLHLEDLAALDAPVLPSGEPLALDIDRIDEDPEQPRHEFDDNALQELAETIRQRGVKQPISVRPHPETEGRWMLNFGARRLRASRLAGLRTIPAFIDHTADSYDQVIENEQRESLRPLELALFVQKRLASGDSQAEIARKLGRSRQYVTLATALIEPPDWLLQLYREGGCTGINELYELRRLAGLHAELVEAWAGEQDRITRDSLPALRTKLSWARQLSASAPADRPTNAPAPDVLTAAAAPTGGSQAKESRQTSRRLHVEMDGQDYQLVVSVAPLKPGHLYVRPLNGGPRRLAPAGSLKLLGFVGS